MGSKINGGGWLTKHSNKIPSQFFVNGSPPRILLLLACYFYCFHPHDKIGYPLSHKIDYCNSMHIGVKHTHDKKWL